MIKRNNPLRFLFALFNCESDHIHAYGGNIMDNEHIEFAELTYDTPGIYYYTMKELTPSGDGWLTDTSEFDIVVTVTDDEHGNLVANVTYPQGYPTFTNIYNTEAVSVVITARKIAEGASLPTGRFVFGLYDEGGRLIESVRNGE